MPCLKGVAQVFLLRTVSSADHLTQTHCADFALTVTKDDGSPVAAAGTLTPRNNGTYRYYATAEEMDCDLLILEGSGTGIDPTVDWFLTEDNYTAARATGIDTIGSTVSDLHTDVGSLATSVGDLHTDVGTANTGIGNLVSSVSDLHTDVGTVDGKVDELTAAVEGMTGGTGANTVTLTVSDGTNVVSGVRLTVHNSTQTDAGLVKYTDANGQAVFGLDNGTYKVVLRTTAQYQETNPFTLEVNGITEQTFTVTPVSIPAPADPAYCTVYCWAQELDGSIPAATFALTAKHSATASGKSILLGADTATVNVTTGYAALTILRGAVVTLELSSATDRRRRERVVVPAADSVNWEDMGAHA